MSLALLCNRIGRSGANLQLGRLASIPFLVCVSLWVIGGESDARWQNGSERCEHFKQRRPCAAETEKGGGVRRDGGRATVGEGE